MFVFENMAIDAILIIAILISVFISVYVVAAIAREWRTYELARSARRRRLASQRALEHPGSAR